MSAIDEILKSKYPAKSHFERVAKYLSSDNIPGAKGSGVVYLESAESKLWPNCDQEQPLRQDRYFYYLTGCEMPDCHVIYNIENAKSTLFIPPIVPEEVVWSGLPMSPEQALKKYV